MGVCCLFEYSSIYFPGVLPFHPDNMEQSVRAKYYAMTGPVWEPISTDAKNLVKRLLVERPQWRLSIQEVLQHDWLQGRAVSDMDLGVDYARRIKHLALREKMRNFFMRNEEWLSNIRLKGDHIQELLPFLKVQGRATYPTPEVPPRHGMRGVHPSDVEVVLPHVEFPTPSSSPRASQLSLDRDMSESVSLSPRSRMPLAQDISVRTFKLRLHNIRDMVQSHDFTCSNSTEKDCTASLCVVKEEASGEGMTGSGQSVGNGTSAPVTRRFSSFTLPPEEIDYETFVEVLTRAGLEALAMPRVFDLFDIGLKGG